jgi:predicted RNA-binding Zn ribbon-like protein
VRAEKLNEYADLLAWGWHVGLLTEAQVKSLLREAQRSSLEADSVLARAVALREAIYRICLAAIDKTKPRATDVELLNRELAAARSHERLAAGHDRYIWRWKDDQKALDRMLWAVTDSAAELLTEGDLTRLRECGGAECGWLFEDTSRNRSRHWCDMQDCGNLAKVRRFRTRQRETQ